MSVGAWLYVWLGLSNAAGPVYLFWSGFGSIVVPPFLTSLPIVLVLLRKHNCHQPRCPRVGRYPAAEGNGWAYCKKHHKHGGEHR